MEVLDKEGLSLLILEVVEVLEWRYRRWGTGGGGAGFARIDELKL